MSLGLRHLEQQGRRTSARCDAGATFVELLVSIVLLGTAGIAVLTALSTTLQSTQVHDRVATAQSQLADAGDVLADVTYASGDPHYIECASPAEYTTLLSTAWPDQAVSFPNVSVAAVDFWDGSGWGICVLGTSQMQRIVLRATVDSLTRELSVVKRKATEASGPGGAWNDSMVTPNPNPGF